MNKRTLFSRRIFVVLGMSFALFASATQATPYKNLWHIWQINNPISKQTIDHSAWQDFLDRRLVTNEEGINLIEYAHLNEKDLSQLKNYISSLTKVNINNFNRKEQLTFWINLYNALTVYTVASYYPVSSIDEINTSPGLFSIGPWAAKLISINNTPLSLDDIQHRIIRPIWNDIRVLYALNNGSIGAANLRKQAYQSALLETQLNEAAFEYINSYRGAQIIDGHLITSKIYEWYEEDFGTSKEDILNHLKLFAKEPFKSQLSKINTIANYTYNWHLNSTVCVKEAKGDKKYSYLK